MAQIVPDVLPHSATAGERRLHALLRRLPEDCVVYYEPMVGGRCPDFVVICPALGLLVIEVKGWRVGDIVAADDRTVQIARHGRPVRHVHPLRQARDYMFALMNRCQAHPAIGPLLRPDGFHENRFLFPFGYFALLTNVSKAQLRAHPGGDLTAVFPTHRVLPREALLELERCPDPQSLQEALRPCFVRSWPFPKLAQKQVEALRAIIHPEIVLELPLEYDDPTPQIVKEQPSITPNVAHVQGAPSSIVPANKPAVCQKPRSATPAPTLKVLDLRQENHARAVGHGHRVLSGVAGSGKTVILIARAKLLARRDPTARILVLCYNVTLASFLRAQLQAHPGVQVCHFEGWAAANRVRRNLPAQENDQAVGERLLAVLEGGRAHDTRRFDAVLVDEAQDFEASWFRCVLAAMRDPQNGDLLIVGDGNQGVYRRGKVSWKALGIQASGRTITSRFGLETNYRNSREIASLAQVFSGEANRHDARSTPVDEDTVGALTLDLNKCPRTTGHPPVLCQEASRSDECARAVTMVKDLLAGRWGGTNLGEALQPEQIGVLYRRIAKAEQPLFAQFLAELQGLAPVRWLNAKDDPKARTRVLEPGVKVQTIHSAKGLQYRAVILLWAGDLPYLPPQSQHDEDAERRLFYVGLTRAEDYLGLVGSEGGQSSYLRQVEHVLSGSFDNLSPARWQMAVPGDSGLKEKGRRV